jgi:NADPH-dependent 2,4-dienoyl-CoA reductase/sulfur reductase-like enzyme
MQKVGAADRRRPSEGDFPVHLLAIGGSDGGISAALRARELDPSVDVTVMLADAYPNFSICGIPYYVSGEVGHWRNLAHRTAEDIEALGIRLMMDTTAHRVDVDAHRVVATDRAGREAVVAYDALVIATGAVPVRPLIGGLDQLGAADAVHVLHTMGDTFEVMQTIERLDPRSAVIVGAGYIGLEMAEALTSRGIAVTQLEQLPEVLPTVDPELGAVVAEELCSHGVEVATSTRVNSIERSGRQLVVRASGPDSRSSERATDMVLVVTGVRPDTGLAAAAGAKLARNGAIEVDTRMRTGLPDVFAAGDCVVTHHRLLGTTYVPLGTTAHKQGRVAGENAVGGEKEFAGSLGTQVVKVFDLVAARTGLREHEAAAGGYQPMTVAATADDHKAYYPGAKTVRTRVTGDRATGRLLGVQQVGERVTAVHKRIDAAAAAIFAGLTIEGVNDLDLSYTPPLGSPWDVLQAACQTWLREAKSVVRAVTP